MVCLFCDNYSFCYINILSKFNWEILDKKFINSATFLQQEQIIIIEQDIILKKVSHSEDRISWKNIIKFDENSKYIFLYQDDLVVTYIPKRIFKAKDQLDKFNNILKERLKMSQSLA